MTDTTRIEAFKSAVQRLSDAGEWLRISKEGGCGTDAAMLAVREAQAAAEEAGLAAWQEFADEARKSLAHMIAALAPAAFFLPYDPGGAQIEDLRAGVDSLFESGEIARALQAFCAPGESEQMPARANGTRLLAS